LPLNTHNHATFLSLNICLVVQKITYLSFLCFYKTEKKRSINQALQEEIIYNRKNKQKHDNSYHFNILQRDRRAKTKREDQAKKNEEQQAQDIHAINYPFEHFLTDEQLNNTLSNSIFDFETACKNLKHSHCKVCHSTSLHLIVHDDVCTTCIQKKRTEKEYQDSLPIWYENFADKKTARFDVPYELSCLREGEKLLIQQISCYVPLQHLRNGQIGCKGHVCCFEQDINEVCTILPRFPSNVKIIRVIKQYRKENADIGKLTFSIRRNVVLKALRWLKKHSIEYQDITIQESNLDWISDGIEQDLPPCNIELEAEDSDLSSSFQDQGPSISQTAEMLDEQEEIPFGILHGTAPHLPKQKDAFITNSLQQATKEANNKNQKATINFPYVSQTPVSEYDTNSGLFSKAFPWLFPGGRGDFHQFRDTKLTVSDWAKNLLLYEDGRFAKDKMWPFYVLNFATRKKNQTSGGYFIDGFFKEGPKNLEDLKAKIQEGDTSWIDRICYYSKLVVGSAGYWRYKKAELYSWIQHHVDAGHGPPTFFMTFSCAEYKWPDIKRLLTDRFQCANLSVPDIEKTSFVRFINDYTIIIQEYFQERLQLWLNTVGRNVFHIKYYWLRFEFAPSRGQIHAHMLGIHENPDVLQEYHRLRGNKTLQALYLQEWAERTFQMTASLPKNAQLEKTHGPHPATQYYSDLTDLTRDKAACLVCLQNHDCNGYCMQKRRYK
jgi:hypothetical protein